MRFVALYLLMSAPLACVGQSLENDKRDRRYNAVLWTQVSPEFEVSVRQTYRMAALQLSTGLADKTRSADEQQRKANDFSEKPPAIILDVDETVLDNSAYNARNIQDRDEFGSATWTAWVSEANAPAVPGAVSFIRSAQEKGVKVFLVSNRRDQHVDATHANLIKAGVKVPKGQLLFRNDEKGRGGSKVSRRAMVAEDYRIVLLVGDNIADLCVDAENPAVARRKLNQFADSWVMIPNSMYGSWERNGGTLRTQRTSRPIVSKPASSAATTNKPAPTTAQPAYELRYCPTHQRWYYAPSHCPPCGTK